MQQGVFPSSECGGISRRLIVPPKMLVSTAQNDLTQATLFRFLRISLNPAWVVSRYSDTLLLALHFRIRIFSWTVLEVNGQARINEVLRQMPSAEWCSYSE